MKCKKCKKEIEELKKCPYCNKNQNTTKKAKNLTSEKPTTKNIYQEIMSNPNKVTTCIIFLIIGYILLNIMVTGVFNLNLFELIINYKYYILMFVYFFFLKKEFGKKNFNLFNIMFGLLLTISLLISILNVLTITSITNLLYSVQSLIVCAYFINSFLRKNIKISQLKKFNNIEYFYSLIGVASVNCIFSIITNLMNKDFYSSIEIIILTILTIMIGRYIYLYNTYKEKK